MLGNAVKRQSAGDEVTRSFSGSAMGRADSLISRAKKALNVGYAFGSGSTISWRVGPSWKDSMKGMMCCLLSEESYSLPIFSL